MILTFLEQSDLERLPKISSKHIEYRRFFHKSGLHSEQIFGPVLDNTCQCGKTITGGGRCKKCKVEYVSSSERRKRLGRIELFIPMMNPIFEWFVPLSATSKNIIVRNVTKLINYEGYAIHLNVDKPDLDFLEYPPEDLSPEEIKAANLPSINDILKDTIVLHGALGAFKYMESLCKNKKLLRKNSILRHFKRFSKYFIIRNIIVVPPDMRPYIKINKSKMSDDLDKLYLQILSKLEPISAAKMYRNMGVPSVLRGIQDDVKSLYKYIEKKIKGKKGLIRNNILGKRVDFSGRAVITPDPKLKLDECRIPYLILVEAYKFHIANMIAPKVKKYFHEIVADIDKSIRDKKYIYKDEIKEICKTHYVILNRQPTLHKHSILGFKIKISPDATIKIHPLVCSAFNADFDGDQMTVHFPITKEGNEEVAESLLSTKNLIYPTTGNLTFTFSQCIILGLYRASLHPVYSKQLPPAMRGKILTKTKLHSILVGLAKKNPQKAVRLIDHLKNVGITISTLTNTPITIKDLAEYCLSKEEIARDYFKHKITPDMTYEERNNAIDKNMAEEKELNKKNFKNFPYKDIILSEARGNWDQVKQLCTARGYIADCTNRIIPEPIMNNLFNGLSPREFFISAYGTRKGLVDIADVTAEAGTLERIFVYALIFLEGGREKDCGTRKLLKTRVFDKKFSYTLINQYYQDENSALIKITEKNCLQLVGKTIWLRSPIFCKNDKFCKTCCPAENPHAAVEGAMRFGELGTQLVLRTFHTSGVASGNKNKGQDKNADIVGDLTSAKSIFLNPSKNKFNSEENVNEFLLKLYKVYGGHKNIRFLYYQFFAVAMMWAKDLSIPYRLLPEKDQIDSNLEILSLQKVPTAFSWLVGSSLDKLKQKLIKNIGSETGTTVLDDILLGQL